MGARGVFSLFLAVLLTAGAILLMFPAWLMELYPEFQLPGELVTFQDLDIYHFPFYGGHEGAYGVVDFLESYADYVATGEADAPDAGAEIARIWKQDGFYATLSSFMLIALLTIPVYMLLRLLAYNSLYSLAETAPFLVRVFLRGIVAASASIVTVFLTWFFYRTLIFEVVLQFLREKLQTLTSYDFALNATNIAMIVLIGAAVIALLRATLFRGSIFTSILTAYLRTFLYIVIIAVIATFIGAMTLRTILFMVAAVFAIGLLKGIFMPEKAKAGR